MTLSEMIAERGRLLSILDLVELMKDFDIQPIYDLALRAGYTQHVIDPEGQADFFHGHTYNTDVEFCDSLGLVVSATVLREIMAGVLAITDAHKRPNTDGMSPSESFEAIKKWSEQFAEHVKGLNDRHIQFRRTFRIEADSIKFLYIERDDARYWNDPTKGWEDAIVAFPDIDYDVREAAKCFALDRYTATVLHSLRVLEVGLKALWSSTGLNPGAASWGGYIEAVHKYATKKDASGTYPPKSYELQEVAAHMGVIKNAWRNRTMHVDATFNNETDASDIFSAARSVMTALTKI